MCLVNIHTSFISLEKADINQSHDRKQHLIAVIKLIGHDSLKFVIKKLFCDTKRQRQIHNSIKKIIVSCSSFYFLFKCYL